MWCTKWCTICISLYTTCCKMAAVLHGRKGDVQCLKALAALAGALAVTFKATDDSRLSLVSQNAPTLHQPNSIMLALGMTDITVLSLCITCHSVGASATTCAEPAGMGTAAPASCPLCTQRGGRHGVPGDPQQASGRRQRKRQPRPPRHRMRPARCWRTVRPAGTLHFLS